MPRKSGRRSSCVARASSRQRRAASQNGTPQSADSVHISSSTAASQSQSPTMPSRRRRCTSCANRSGLCLASQPIRLRLPGFARATSRTSPAVCRISSFGESHSRCRCATFLAEMFR